MSEEKKKIGEIQIANEVIACIAGISASEVEGVDSLSGNITNEIAGKLGVKSNSKGVKVDINDGEVNIELAINMKYGFSIPETCSQVQDKVSQTINSMTGMVVSNVNVRIAGVAMSEQE